MFTVFELLDLNAYFSFEILELYILESRNFDVRRSQSADVSSYPNTRNLGLLLPTYFFVQTMILSEKFYWNSLVYYSIVYVHIEFSVSGPIFCSPVPMTTTKLNLSSNGLWRFICLSDLWRPVLVCLWDFHSEHLPWGGNIWKWFEGKLVVKDPPPPKLDFFFLKKTPPPPTTRNEILKKTPTTQMTFFGFFPKIAFLGLIFPQKRRDAFFLGYISYFLRKIIYIYPLFFRRKKGKNPQKIRFFKKRPPNSIFF